MLSQWRYIRSNRKRLSSQSLNQLNLSSDRHTFCIFPGIEPEAATSPEGGLYDSAASLAFELRSRFPNSQILYKDHPNSVSFILSDNLSLAGAYRSKSFLQLLHSLNVDLINGEEFDRLNKENQIFVVTLTGTIAIERSLQGKPTIVAGLPYYGRIPLTYTLDELTNDSLSIIHRQRSSVSIIDHLTRMFDNFCLSNPFGIGTNIKSPLTTECISQYIALFKSL